MNNILKIIGKNLIATIITAVIVIGSVSYFVVQGVIDNAKSNDNIVQTTSDDKKVDETGYIYVDGGDGVLSNESKYGGYSYIGESARGTEAYLAGEGLTANYIFNAEKSGNYRLEISLSDDAVHNDGSRDTTVVMNGDGKLSYKHQSEKTNGWKWYSLGVLSVKEGENKIIFTKDETTSAAFVMDQFRLIPVAMIE